MKHLKPIFLLAIGLLLSTSVVYSQDVPDEQPGTSVEAYTKTEIVQPVHIDVVAVEQSNVCNIAITEIKSSTLLYAYDVPPYAYDVPLAHRYIKSTMKDGIYNLLKIPILRC